MQKPRSFWAGVHRILSTKTEFANGIELTLIYTIIYEKCYLLDISHIQQYAHENV